MKKNLAFTLMDQKKLAEKKVPYRPSFYHLVSNGALHVYQSLGQSPKTRLPDYVTWDLD